MSGSSKFNKGKILACFSCAFIMFAISSCKKNKPIASSSSLPSSSVVSISTSSSHSSKSSSSSMSKPSSSVESIVSSISSIEETSSDDTSVYSSEDGSSVSSSSESTSENVSTSNSSVTTSDSSVSTSSNNSSLSSSSSIDGSSVVSSSESTSTSSSNSSISSSDSVSSDSSSSEEVLLDFDASVKMDDKIVSYDGNEHEIVVEGAPEGTTITYKNNKNSYINAGSYSIEATLEKEGYNSKTLTATLTIKKIDINVDDIVITDVVTQYDGKNKKVTVNGLPSGVTSNIKYYTDEAHTQETTNTKDVGKYYAVISFNVGQNYNELEDMYRTIEITKKTYDISNISIKDISYNANVLTKEDIVINNLPKSLSVSDVKFYATNTSNEEIEVIDVGNYYAFVTFANDNSLYEDIQPTERLEFNVVKKEITVNWSNLSVIYNGKEQTPSFSLDTDLFDGDDVVAKLVGESQIRIGTYDVTVQLEGKDASNYELKNASVKFVINSPSSIVKVESKEQFSEGYYVFTYDNLAFLPEKIAERDKDNRVPEEKFVGDLNYNTFEINRLWYIEKEGENYYIKAPDGKYVEPSKTGFVLSDKKTAWTLSVSSMELFNNNKTIKYNDGQKQFGYYGITSCNKVNYYRVSHYDSYNITVNELDSSLGTAQVVSSTGSFEELYCFDKIKITGIIADGKVLDHIKVGDKEYEFEYDVDTREFRCEFIPSASGTLLFDIIDVAREREVTVTQGDNLTITAKDKYLDREEVTITVAPNSDDYYVKEVIVKDSDENAVTTTKNGNNYSFVMPEGKNITITAVAGHTYLVNVVPNENCEVVLKNEEDYIYENNTKIPDNVKLIVDVIPVKPYYVVSKLEVNEKELLEENDCYSFEVKENATIKTTISKMEETKIVDIPSSTVYNGEYYLSSGIVKSLSSTENGSSYLLDYNNKNSELQIYKFGNKNEFNAMNEAGIMIDDYLMVFGEYEYYYSRRELKSVSIVDYVGAIRNLTLSGEKIVWKCNYATSFDVYDGDKLVAEGIKEKEFALTNEMKQMDVCVNFRVVAHGLNGIMTSSAELEVTYLKSYSITYVYNDGKTENLTTDKQVAIPNSLEELSRDGYVFLGWFTDETCLEEVNPGEKLSSNITLYAGWIKAYTVTYVYNDEVTNDKVLIKQTELPEALEKPTREGYSFDGWFSDEQFGTKVNGGEVLSEDLVLYAKWRAIRIITVEPNENIEVTDLDTNGYVEEDDIRFTITPKEGYRISSIVAKANGVEYENYIYDNASGELKITVPSSDVKITVSVVRIYNVSIDTGDNATHFWDYENNSSMIDEGTNIDILFEADDGYVIDKALVNGKEVILEDDSYTISGINANYIIEIKTKLIDVTKVNELTSNKSLVNVKLDEIDEDYAFLSDDTGSIKVEKELLSELVVGTRYYLFGSYDAESTIFTLTKDGVVIVINKATDIRFTENGELTWNIDTRDNSIVELYINDEKQDLLSDTSFTLLEEMKVKNTPLNIVVKHIVGSDVVESSITLTYLTTYKITYSLGYESETEIPEDDSDSLPILPTPAKREGYIFVGWFYEDTFTTKANEGDKLSSNVVLYAKWTESMETTVVNILSGYNENNKTEFTNNGITFTSNVAAFGKDSSKGVQFTKSSISSAVNGEMILETSESLTGIMSITLNVNTNGNITDKKAIIHVFVGETEIKGEIDYINKQKEQINLSFTSEIPLSGKIKIQISTNETEKSVYINTITIN